MNFNPPSLCVLAEEGLKEEMSDNCMQELMGSAATDYRKCAVTAECMERMLERGHGEYTITHQLLYTLLAEEVMFADN